MNSNVSATAAFAYLDQHEPRLLEEICALVRIPSDSKSGSHGADLRRAAELVRDRLGAAGLANPRLLEAGGNPAVTAEWTQRSDAPTVLVYGHYDVQPAEPLAAWSSPPYAPEIRDGRIYGRGASDDKGNALVPVAAIEALLATAGTLPVNVRILIEGEEEVGSRHLPALLTSHRDELACDVVFSADGNQLGEEQPSVPLSLRGSCSLQIDVTGPALDLHSGLYGGLIANPLHALAHILATMHHADGSVAVAGFYDDVVPLDDAGRSSVADAPLDLPGMLRAAGVAADVGEAGYAPAERLWLRPTLEVNGMGGGYQGEGGKAIIPARASAKISCRLVPDQQPAPIVAAVAAHVAAHCPPGCSAEVRSISQGGKPYVLPDDHWALAAAEAALAATYERAPVRSRFGATIPCCAMFREHLGAETVMFSFALADERAHGPDEFFRVASFRRGCRAYVALLEQLAGAYSSVAGSPSSPSARG